MVSIGAYIEDGSQLCHGSGATTAALQSELEALPPDEQNSTTTTATTNAASIAGNSGNGSCWYDDSADDVAYLREELLEKERNLLLAAQFGKSLLEKNHEISTQAQADKDAYEAIIEELREHNHDLKMQLDRVETNFELRLASLEGELTSARSANDHLRDTNEELYQDKSRLLQELSAQHATFTNTINSASSTEEELRLELTRARDQINKELTNQNESQQVTLVLQHEVAQLSDRLAEHSRKSRAAESERLQLVSLSESLSNQIQQAENENTALKQQICELEQELSDATDKLYMLQQSGVTGSAIPSGLLSPTQCESIEGSYDGSVMLSPTHVFHKNNFHEDDDDDEDINRSSWLKESADFHQFSLEQNESTDDQTNQLTATQMDALRRANEDLLQITTIIANLCNQTSQSQYGHNQPPSCNKKPHQISSRHNSRSPGRSSCNSSTDMSFHSPRRISDSPIRVISESNESPKSESLAVVVHSPTASPGRVSTTHLSRRFDSPSRLATRLDSPSRVSPTVKSPSRTSPRTESPLTRQSRTESPCRFSANHISPRLNLSSRLDSPDRRPSSRVDSPNRQLSYRFDSPRRVPSRFSSPGRAATPLSSSNKNETTNGVDESSSFSCDTTSPSQPIISIAILADRIADFKRFVVQLQQPSSNVISCVVPDFEEKLTNLQHLVSAFPDDRHNELIIRMQQQVEDSLLEKQRAIDRQTEAEIELAKERVKCKEVQEELLETLKSKINLSQQLENLQYNDFTSAVPPQPFVSHQSPARSPASGRTTNTSAVASSSESDSSPKGSPLRRMPAAAASGITRRFSFFRQYQSIN